VVYEGDPLEIYRREVLTVPALTPEREGELARHVLANDAQAQAAGKDLVEANLAMVIEIAERYRGGKIHVLDLIVEGNQALLGALKTFAASGQTYTGHARACVAAAIAKASGGE